MPIVVELYHGGLGAHQGICAALAAAQPGVAWSHVLVDHDPACHATAARFAPDAVRVMAEITPEADGVPPDVVLAEREIALTWASSPCQPHSMAGDRLGSDDPRDGWPSVIAHVRRWAPHRVIVKNVLGAPFVDWALDLTRAGYHVRHWELDAADYGVPQHRRRGFLCGWKDHLFAAHKIPLRGPAITHAEASMFHPGWRTMRHALPDLEAEASAAWAKFVADGNEIPPVPLHPPWWYLAAPWRTVARTVGADGDAAVDVELHVTRAAYVGGGNHPHYPGEERTLRVLDNEPATTVCAERFESQRPQAVSVHYPPGRSRAASEPERLDRPSPTVTTTEVKGTRASKASGWTFHGGPDRASDGAFLAVGRRRLTVREVAALQDFPPWMEWEGTSEDQYRQIGNAVPPRLAQVVTAAVMEVPRVR